MGWFLNSHQRHATAENGRNIIAMALRRLLKSPNASDFIAGCCSHHPLPLAPISAHTHHFLGPKSLCSGWLLHSHHPHLPQQHKTITPSRIHPQRPPNHRRTSSPSLRLHQRCILRSFSCVAASESENLVFLVDCCLRVLTVPPISGSRRLLEAPNHL